MVHVRSVHDSEFGAWADAFHVGFMAPQRRGDDRASEHMFGRGRCTGGFDGGTVVATMRGLDLELSVPGGALLPACGITSVTVAATHRRTGLLTRMMARELDAARERGDPLAVLVTSQWPLYARFGFGPAVYKTGLEIDARDLRTVRTLPGRVQFADPATARMHAPAVYERAGRRLAGVIGRSEEFWDRHFDITNSADEAQDTGVLHILFHDDAGAVTGYASYAVAEQWTRAERPQCIVKVRELIADDALAEARLWMFLAEHDWVTTVTAGGQPTDAPWPLLLTDARAVHQTHRLDAAVAARARSSSRAGQAPL